MFGEIGKNYTKLKCYVIWLFRLYELNTQIAICEPWEKVFCHVLLASCVSLIMYASYAYVPGYCRTLVSYLMPVSVGINQTFGNINCAEADGVCSSTPPYIT